MNNRSANKENTYSNLAAWCEKHHKDTGIKVHPSSVPVDLVLEDLMGYIALLMSHDKTNTTITDRMSKLFDELYHAYGTHVVSTRDALLALDEKIMDLDERFKKIEDILLNQAAQVVKETKKAKK